MLRRRQPDMRAFYWTCSAGELHRTEQGSRCKLPQDQVRAPND